MATVPPTGGAVAPPGGAVVQPGGTAPGFGLHQSATMINARAMGTDHWQQRRIKTRSVNSFMAFRCKYPKRPHLMHYW